MTFDNTSSRTSVTRCRTCGYRLQASFEQCSECGGAGRVQPLTRREVRRQIALFFLQASPGWSAGLIAAIAAQFATRFDWLGLFMCGVAVMLFFAPIIGLGWAVVISSRWVNRSLLVLCSIRDGEIGPWSGISVRIGVFVILLMVQLLGGAMAFVAGRAIFPDYPAHWP